ncbi:MAG: DoxX family membrane protein [Proteobacteria bacterium]|nr:DoxX family membrane protein [Pseudomonadota bacterium]
MIKLLNHAQDLLDKTRIADGLAPLLMRIYLFLPLWEAGVNKLRGFPDTVSWFGDSLGLPFPTLMAVMAIMAELGGSMALLAGVATRWATVPLMVTMLVAIFSVHLGNGWLAIAASDSYWFGMMEGATALTQFKEWAQDYPQYQELVRHGPLVLLNNGIEFAATYFIMLLSLFFTGAGTLSLDALIVRRFRNRAA